MTQRRCRFCSSPLTQSFADLGMSPLSNSFLKAEQLDSMEAFYPLHALVCGQCFLVQLEQFRAPEHIFSDYAYFSSYSATWLQHCEQFATVAAERFRLGTSSQVVEVASNDGYLLQYFRKRGIPVLGIEPASNVAAVAERAGVTTRVAFFGENLAQQVAAEGLGAELLIANNVLAHVPDLNDFVRGLRTLLAPRGVLTLEIPHLLRLIERNEFDTIYHEHFSYFSFLTVERVLAAHSLTVFDVERLPTHGGSLRIFARHAADDSKPCADRVQSLREEERAFGMDGVTVYQTFAKQVERTKRELLTCLIELKRQGRSIAGYGAPAKGNTLLNYCGIRTDFIDYTVDRNPHKQNLFLPGTHIPIYAPEKIRETRPDYVLILPWNLRDEIVEQMAWIREWGGRFIIPIPSPEVVS